MNQPSLYKLLTDMTVAGADPASLITALDEAETFDDPALVNYTAILISQYTRSVLQYAEPLVFDEGYRQQIQTRIEAKLKLTNEGPGGLLRSIQKLDILLEISDPSPTKVRILRAAAAAHAAVTLPTNEDTSFCFVHHPQASPNYHLLTLITKSPRLRSLLLEKYPFTTEDHRPPQTSTFEITFSTPVMDHERIVRIVQKLTRRLYPPGTLLLIQHPPTGRS